MRYSNSKKGENSRLYGIIEANNKDLFSKAQIVCFYFSILMVLLLSVSLFRPLLL